MYNKRRAHANKCIIIQNIDLSRWNISFDKKALHLLLPHLSVSNMEHNMNGKPRGWTEPTFDQGHFGNGVHQDNCKRKAITKNSSSFHIDPYSSSINSKKEKDNVWKMIFLNRDNYKIMDVLRKKILLDLERQFGCKIEHDRLFSCLGKIAEILLYLFLQITINPTISTLVKHIDFCF